MAMLADPKPARRIRDKAAVSRFLLANAWCEACEFRPSNHAHHVLFRSHSGDDVTSNLLALCILCHRAVHEGQSHHAGRVEVALAVRRRVDVLDYLDGKLGSDAAGVFLERVYPLA